MDKTFKHVIAVFSGKGGVGKSTVSANIAETFAKQGNNVGLLDVDLHGPNIPKLLGLESVKLEARDNQILPAYYSPNLKVVSIAFMLPTRDTPVIWRGPLKHKAVSQLLNDVDWGELDYLVIDFPPGTGDEILSVSQLVGKDANAVIVTTPQELALLDARKAVMFAKQVEMSIAGIVENMSGLVCPHCGKEINLFKKGGGKKAAEELGVPFLGGIPLDPRIVELSDDGILFVDKYPDSPVAVAFSAVCENLRKSLEEGV